YIVAGEDATLGDQRDASGQLGREAFGHRETRGKGAQIAIVDPDQLRASLERRVEFALVVDLHERVEAEFDGAHPQSIERAGRERRDDQQQSVCTRDAGFIDLVGLNHEVLAQKRHWCDRAHELKLVEPPAEEALVRQDGDRSGAAIGVGLRTFGRIKTGSNLTTGRGAPLDLRDDARPGCRLESRAKAARRAAHLIRGPLHLRLRHLLLCRSQLHGLVRENVAQDRHAPSCTSAVARTREARRALAAPESTLSRATTRPSASPLAAPATQSAAAAFKRTMSRRGPDSPSSTARTITAFSRASPPRRSSSRARGRPNSAASNTSSVS